MHFWYIIKTYSLKISPEKRYDEMNLYTSHAENEQYKKQKTKIFQFATYVPTKITWLEATIDRFSVQTISGDFTTALEIAKTIMEILFEKKYIWDKHDMLAFTKA